MSKGVKDNFGSTFSKGGILKVEVILFYLEHFVILGTILIH